MIFCVPRARASDVNLFRNEDGKPTAKARRLTVFIFRFPTQGERVADVTGVCAL